MILDPRTYQIEAVEAALREFDKGVQSTLIRLPTGTGKTIVFAIIGHARNWGKVLVLAGRRELITQAQSKILLVTGDKPDIEMGESYAPTASYALFEASKYVCASIQTIGKRRRLNRFDWSDFGLVVVDECHHVEAKSYQDVLTAIKAANPNVKILGVTATPNRSDKRPLGRTFETVAYNYEVLDAINHGYLVPIHQKFASITGLDISSVRTRGGDLDDNQLAARFQDGGGQVVGKIAAAMMEAAKREKCVIFTPDVQSAYDVANLLNGPDMAGPGRAVAMDGNKSVWDDRRRAMTLEAYERGEFQFLVNCALFTEGWDSPTTSVIGIGRPTESESLYTQMMGRGLRTLPGTIDHLPAFAQAAIRRSLIDQSDKRRALIIDIVGVSGKHKLVSSIDILGGEYDAEVRERAKQRVDESGGKAMPSVPELLEEEKERLAVERQEAEDRRDRENQRVSVRANVEFIDVSPFERGGTTADNGISRGPRLATAPQIEYLEKVGIDARGMEYDDAVRLTRESYYRREHGLCSIKQKHALEKHGYSSDLTKEQAMRVIDVVSGNGWKKPEWDGTRDAVRIRVDKDTGQFGVRIAEADGRRIDVGSLHGTVEEARRYGEAVVEAMTRASQRPV